MNGVIQVQRRARPAGERGSFARADELAAALRDVVRGEVRFDQGSRALYATDASNYRQTPIGVVLPADVEDVVRAVAVCRRFEAPILSRGGGTSLAGQCCNAGVVLDMSKYMHTILELDVERRRARVQPGVVLDTLRHAAERHHLTFGPDPATHDHCTLGGMIGNNSCGVHALMAGKTADNVEELDVLTYDGLRLRAGRTGDAELEAIIAAGGRRGEIYAGLKRIRDTYADRIRARFPKIPRRVSGYNLDELLPENGFNVARALVGTESTCVTVLEAHLALVPSPPARVLVVLGYPDVFMACDQVPKILEHRPIGLEGFDDRLLDDMRRKGMHPEDVALLPDGRGWLLVEFGADDRRAAVARATALVAALKRSRHAPSVEVFEDAGQAKKIWEVRESALGATARVPGRPSDFWPGWEDSAVPPERMGDYLRDLRALLDRSGHDGAFYGHFGQGCLHTRIDFDLKTAPGIERFRKFIYEAADLVLRYGGSFSGEHGDGQARAELLPKLYGEDLVRAFGEFKALWDPDNGMNPGKMVHPYRIEQNLRLGTAYNPPPLKTHFAYAEDRHSFAEATLRCVGIGKCRHMEGGTMCPSYMVTREEEHSTRGRARLLFEMLQGDPLTGGWRSAHVKEALDLCLACKGCKGDCPVSVDMATYKAEFLSHYYAGRWRPVHAYAFGMIYRWARLASLMPGAANFFSQTPGLRSLARAAIGMAPQRQIPVFAPQPFTRWFKERGERNSGKPEVLLWPDTFNNYFHPETAIAAVEVLEWAGYRVIIPEQSLCCGRPLYDYGMLDEAKRLLRQILDALGPHIAAGTPLVGLEPSCVAVFRDELTNLLPHDEDARRLKEQSFLLSEFLIDRASGFQPPLLRRSALVHGHCHHKAVLGMAAEERALQRVGLHYTMLDSGCCGMAGAFGFEREHYDISLKVGERVLLPAVRSAENHTLIVADGFSCREQIRQTTGRRALHLAEVLQMAIRQEVALPVRAQSSPDGAPRARGGTPPGVAALAGVGAMAGYGAVRWARTRMEQRDGGASRARESRGELR